MFPGINWYLCLAQLTQFTENIQTALDELAPVKTITIKKKIPPWISSEIGLLMSKRDATHNKYLRTGYRPTLDKFLRLCESVEMQADAARCAFMHTKIIEVIGENKNVWKELCNLLFSRRAELHGFTTQEMNSYFASISISLNEEYSYAHNIRNSASINGFSFKPVTVNDIILAVSHFKSQAKGEDGIPQSTIAKELPSIAPQLVRLFNESIVQGILPTA